MQPHLSTTPFGRRSLTLAHVAAQTSARERPPEKAVHKWHVYRAICAAKVRLGASERALAVLNALLTFHPETVLTGEGLIVFPSNEQLSARAHGMAPSTLRRQLAELVDLGLIIRRDSPNGKRFARKDSGGSVAMAFGFDLGPLVARAEEFSTLAEEVAADDRAYRLARERVTLCRRDIVKMIATGVEEDVPTRRAGQGPSDWSEVHRLFRSIMDRMPRKPTLGQYEGAAEELTALADEVLFLLETHAKTQKSSTNESQNERHIQNSNPNCFPELEPVSRRDQAEPAAPELQTNAGADGGFPLGMILEACPDIVDYAKHGISNWRDLLATAGVVRSVIGISPSAWEEARSILGEVRAAIVVACILQRSEAIRSAGGYLRELTRKAEAGEFSMGPMVMALLGTRRKVGKTCMRKRA